MLSTPPSAGLLSEWLHKLIALTWDDIDLNNKTININKSTGYVNKQMITKSPKNRSSIRKITIPGPIIDLIKKYRTEQLEYKLSIGDQWKGDNYVFIQWNGTQMHLASPYGTFKDITKKYNSTIKDDANKIPDIPMHGLRHTSATLLISENVDVRTVSARLGHAQTSTTMNIYAHSLKKSDEKASDALSNILIKRA